MNQGQRIGRYEVLEEIASGGQGSVYRVRDMTLDRIVALKVLHPHWARNAQYRERFLREARTAASLTHPNVVTIYEVGEEGDHLFIAMEYLPRSLHDVLEEKGSLDIESAINMTIQMASALQAAHERNIVHRDIKPQNVLVGLDDTYKLTDFGIARAGDLSTMTATGTVMGSPPYMSPEQVRGERADIRSDIYSLGITFFNCLTGEPPFKADTPLAVLRQHTDVQPPRVSQLRPDVPRDVDDAVQRCLEKDPARRYQTPAELALDLGRALPAASPGPQQTTPEPTSTAPVTEQPQPPTPSAAPSGPIFCANCGERLGPEARYCRACGAAVALAGPTPTARQAVSPISSGQPDRKPTPAEAAAEDQHYAGFWRRFAAGIVDVAIISTVLIVTSAATPTSTVGLITFLGVFIFLGPPLYFILMTGLRGQTLGKMVLRIKVVKPGRKRPGIWTALLREVIGKFLSAIVLSLGYFWIGWDNAKQGWHDKIAGTYVVGVPRRQRQALATPMPRESATAPSPARPSDTWMEAWANAWQKTNRRRFAWIGTILTLVIGIVFTLVRFGVFDELINPDQSPVATVSAPISEAFGGSAIATFLDGQNFEVSIPPGAIDSPHTLILRLLEQTELATLAPEPQSFELLRAFEVNLETVEGQQVISPEFNRMVTIRATYSDEELIGRTAGPSSLLNIFWLDDSISNWISLPTTIDTVNRFLTAKVDHFSIFAVGVALEPGPTPTPTPSPTATATPTPRPTPTATPTIRPSPTPTRITRPTFTPTPTQTPTADIGFFTLEIVVAPSAGGKVSIEPVGENRAYRIGQKVTLTAHPASGYQFRWWLEREVSFENPLTIIMDRDRTLTASFILATSIVTPTPTPIPVPQVIFAGARFFTAETEGSRITVPVGSTIAVYVTLESNTATEGQLEVHIVRDIVLATDDTKKLCASKVSLEAGLNEILACDFVADQLSSGSLRHYFVKVQWNGDFIYDPLDPETREAISTIPAVTPTPA